MLPPRSTNDLVRKLCDIYIDNSHVNFVVAKASVFHFLAGICNVELQHCIYVHFAFKMFCVVLQHLRNSQGPLIFLQTVVCKLMTKLTVSLYLCCIILILHCVSLDCLCTVF